MCGISTVAWRFLKRWMALMITASVVSRGLSSWNSMCSAPSMRARGLVVISGVW